MVLVWCAVWGAIGGALGTGRQVGTAGGVFLGALLGPIGVAVTALYKGNDSAPAPAPASVLDRIERRPDTAGWHPDPLGRFQARYWDGERWTQHVGRVAADGTREQLEDPV